MHKYPQVKILDLMKVLFLTFSGTSILSSIIAAPFCIPANSVQGCQFPHILANNYSLFLIGILTGVGWYLILIFLMKVTNSNPLKFWSMLYPCYFPPIPHLINVPKYLTYLALNLGIVQGSFPGFGLPISLISSIFLLYFKYYALDKNYNNTKLTNIRKT